MSATTEYRSVRARNPRGRTPPLHIAAYDASPGGHPRRIRMSDKTLCHIYAAHYPEGGHLSEPASATCPVCRRRYARLVAKNSTEGSD